MFEKNTCEFFLYFKCHNNEHDPRNKCWKKCVMIIKIE